MVGELSDRSLQDFTIKDSQEKLNVMVGWLKQIFQSGFAQPQDATLSYVLTKLQEADAMPATRLASLIFNPLADSASAEVALPSFRLADELISGCSGSSEQTLTALCPLEQASREFIWVDFNSSSLGHSYQLLSGWVQ